MKSPFVPTINSTYAAMIAAAAENGHTEADNDFETAFVNDWGAISTPVSICSALQAGV